MFLSVAAADHPLRLPAAEGAAEQVHQFDKKEILAINTAIAARRALLVRGEPGTGKTQLAKAAAVALKRAFVSYTVDSRTDARDLLWHFDAVSRLAEAQVQGARHEQVSHIGPLRDLSIRRFIQPRPVWWAFNWADAEDQAKRSGAAVPAALPGCHAENGVVVLIDEIDKADTEVPNGLLEALGAGEFTPQGFGDPVRATPNRPTPLVIITTNEDRSLPDAFLRRCLVLLLALPTEGPDLIAHLVARGRAHFDKNEIANTVLRAAAELVNQDRALAKAKNWRPFPGQAEYLDLLRAIKNLAPNDPRGQAAKLADIKGFVLHKHGEVDHVE